VIARNFIVMKHHEAAGSYEPMGQATQGFPDRPTADAEAARLALKHKDDAFAAFERVSVVRAELAAVAREDFR
jgi:hypothetical protein